MRLYNTPVLNPVKRPGIAAIDCPSGRFQYELSRTPPDTVAAKNCVLDLVSPLYSPGSKATWYDRSGKNNHGTIIGATWARLLSGLWYPVLNGVDSLVTNPLNPSVTFGTTFTISAWIYPTALTSYRGVAGDHNANQGIVFFQYAIVEDGGWSCAYGNGATYVNTNITAYVNGVAQGSPKGMTLTVNKWQKVTGVFNNVTTIQHRTTFPFGRAFDGANRYFQGGIAQPEIILSAKSAMEEANSYQWERSLFGVG